MRIFASLALQKACRTRRIKHLFLIHLSEGVLLISFSSKSSPNGTPKPFRAKSPTFGACSPARLPGDEVLLQCATYKKILSYTSTRVYIRAATGMLSGFFCALTVFSFSFHRGGSALFSSRKGFRSYREDAMNSERTPLSAGSLF